MSILFCLSSLSHLKHDLYQVIIMTNNYKYIHDIISNYIISDLANIVMEYISPKLKDLKCESCSWEIKLFDFDDHEVVVGDNHKSPISTSEDYCFYCTNPQCESSYILCEKCSDVMEEYEETREIYPIVLCQFLGYDDCDKPYVYEDHPIMIGNDNLDQIEINYVNKNQYYVNHDELEKPLTGYSGGGTHYWKCNICNEIYILTDK